MNTALYMAMRTVGADAPELTLGDSYEKRT